MFRVAENFRVVNPKKLEEPIEGLTVGEAKRSSPISVVRGYTLTLDFETKESYEKGFKILNERMLEVLDKLGVLGESVRNIEIKVSLLDEPKAAKSTSSEEPMTWRKWHEERIKNRK